jgi:cytochrome c-type biogenesis protein CcmH/NrfG
VLLSFAEAPRREDVIRQRTYKTKEEVEKSKTVTTTVVVTLLIIAVVVPMLQYYG